MKKRFVAFLLVLIMVLGMLPVSAMAALDTGHMIDVTFTVLYVGEEFRIGYNYGTSENTQFVCQYTTNHSDTAYNNHTIAISDIKAAANRATVNSGYKIVGWTKKANADPTILDLNAPNATACNKGTTIYLVAKIPAPPTVTYILNYQPGTTDRVANMPGQQYEENNAGKATFTVSEKIPTRDGYTFKYWETSAHTRVGNTVDVTAANNPMNIYAVWEKKQHEHHDGNGDGFCDDDNTCMHPKDDKGNCTVSGCTHPDSCCPKPEAPKPPKPEKPGDGDKPTVAVKIKCVQPQSVVKHNDSDNAMRTRIAGNSYTVNGNVREGEYKGKTRYYVDCTVTEPIQTFVDAFNIAHKGHTEADSPAHVRTFMLWYFPENEEKGEPVWQQDVTPTFYVKCEVTPPTDTYVVVYTDGVEDDEVFADQRYENLNAGDPTPAFGKDPYRGGYTFAGWEPEVAATVTGNVTYVAQWTKNEVEPAKPTGTDLDLAVKVLCLDNNAHQELYNVIGTEGEDYFVYTPVKNADGDWTCDVSIVSADPYVTEFNKTYANHVSAERKITPATLTWIEDEDSANGGYWFPTTPAVVEVVEVIEKFPVHVVIYRNGNTTKAFKDIALESQPKGHVIDLTALDIADYYTGTYDFYGWYDDGLWNIYNANVAAGKDAPTGMSEKTVNSWTNIKCMVYDYENVVYFNTEEDRAAYQADNSLTHLILKSTTARYGDPLPTPDAPTATREGHTFKYWSREGQTVDVTGQTVNGWTNLYAAWDVNSYNVEIYQYFEDTKETKKLGDTKTALYGTNILEFLNGLNLDLDVDGYTLDTFEDGSTKWYKKDAPAFTFTANDTIGGWTNVLLKYNVAPHNIYAYARVNTAFGPLTKPEFYEDVNFKLSTDDQSSLGLGKYNSNGYFSIGTFEFDDLPLTEDMYFNDATVAKAAEKAAKVLATDIALEPGVKKATAAKIAWTYLYKADDSEGSDYMYKSGYPTNDEDGYQLSGNLYLMAVMYDTNAGGDEVKDMPAVKYIYDDGVAEIYDFEFPGTTIQLPTPKRLGYTFKGWSVEVIEGDNEKDADRYDMTGADDGDAEETLYNGSYDSSETAGVLKFTAQWEKEEYTLVYHANGGYLTRDPKKDKTSSTFQVGKEATLKNAETFTRVGYTFVGWATDENAATKEYDGSQKFATGYPGAVKDGKYDLYAVWTPKHDVKYTVKYVRADDHDVTVATTKTVENQTFDTTVEETAVSVTGYTVVAPDKQNVKLDAYNKVIIFEYTPNTDVSYTVKYVRQDDHTVELAAEKKVENQTFDTTVEETAVTVTGYTVVAPDKQSVKLDAYNKVIIFEYTPNTDVSYTVKYVRQDDHTVELAAEKKVENKTFDTTVEETAVSVTGYTVVAPDKQSVKLDAYNKVITFEYTPNTYSYTIEYYAQDKTSTETPEYFSKIHTETKSGLYDTTVTLTDAEKNAKIPDAHYSFDAAQSKVSGTIDGDNTLVLKVYYKLDSHTLTYLDSRNGSVIGTTTVRCGVSVAAPKDPTKAGYWFDGWYNAADNKKVTFPVTLDHDMTVYAGWTMIVLPGTITKKTPKLNTADHFAYVQGYPDGTVKPAGNITRAETAAILFRLMDDSSRNTYYSTKSGFRDVSLGTWYNTYVATLNNAGVITDSANGYFRPNEAITRAELAAMLAAFTDTTRAANYFNDVSAKYWAANAIAICAKLGWINGYPDGSFRPDKNVTRAELMAMINRATGRAPKSADAFLSGMKTWKDNTADKWYYLDVQEATNSHSYTVRNSEVWTALNAAPNWSKYE